MIKLTRIFLIYSVFIFLLGCTNSLKKSSNKSNEEFKKAFGDLYLITLVINYMGNDYEKETFPLFDDCEEGMEAAEKKFKAAPLMKLKKIKCIPLNEIKYREKYNF